MITRVRAYSRTEMSNIKDRLLSLPNIWMISISGCESEPLFERSRDRLLCLRFDDMWEQTDEIINLDTGERFEANLFSEEQAGLVLDHIMEAEKYHGASALAVNCYGGISRSGAVAQFTRDLFKLDLETFEQENSRIQPNSYVTKLLFREAEARGLLP